MPAGYSKKSLVDKLGIKDGFTIAIVGSPENYAATLGSLPSGLESHFPKLKAALSPRGMLWVSWPKGSSGVLTDLTENVVREIGLRNGLVDIKVCAVDETWSGLKFVFRLKDRRSADL